MTNYYDYYAFGSYQPRRVVESAGTYSFGFNSQEKKDDYSVAGDQRPPFHVIPGAKPLSNDHSHGHELADCLRDKYINLLPRSTRNPKEFVMPNFRLDIRSPDVKIDHLSAPIVPYYEYQPGSSTGNATPAGDGSSSTSAPLESSWHPQ